MPTWRLALILSGCLLLCTCTEDSPTESGTEPNPVTIPVFTVDYTTDNARAASATISASSGGSLTATDADGTTFNITIPPDALDSNTTITITPLSCLTIAGPGATRCSDHDTSGGTCCLTGALFEPSGLAFKEPVALEIGYSGDFPFKRCGTMIWFDVADSAFVPCSTLVDTVNGSLQAQIHHFSGYGAAAPDSAQLWAAYELWWAEASRAVGESPGFYYSLKALLNIASSNWQLDTFGEAEPICPGLNELIEQTAIDLLNQHGQILYDVTRYTLSREDAETLILFHVVLDEIRYRLTGYLEWACTQNQALAIAGIDPIVRKFAEQGRAACDQDDCDGRDALQWAFNVWTRGYFKDNTYGAMIRNWLEDCCSELNVEISVTPRTLRRAGLTPDDTQGTYATVTVTVTGQSGQPKEGVFVAVKWSKNISTLCSGETDAAGTFVGYFSAHLPTVAYTCQRFLEYDVWAEASWVGGSFSSPDVPVIFQNAVVSASHSYSYDLYHDNGQITTTTTCTVSGTVEAPAGGCFAGGCGTLTRSYHHQRGTYSIDLIDLATIDLCNATASFASQQITVGDGQVLTTMYINGISISSPCTMFEQVVLQACDPSTGCTSDTTDIPSGIQFSFGIVYPYICDGLFLNGDGSGGYDIWLWTLDDELRTATWSIDASVGY